MSCPPQSDTSIAAPAISRVSRQHLYRLSLPIILWYHTVRPYYDTSRLPNYSRQQLLTGPSLRMVEYHSTPPIAGSFRLLSSLSSYRFLLYTVPSPSCLSIKPFAVPGFFKAPWASSTLFRVYVLYVSDLHRRCRLSLVPKCHFRPRVRLLPRYATSATRSRRDCDVTSPPLP